MYFWHLPSIYFCQFAFTCIRFLLYFLLSLFSERQAPAGACREPTFRCQKRIFLIFSASNIFGCPVPGCTHAVCVWGVHYFPEASSDPYVTVAVGCQTWTSPVPAGHMQTCPHRSFAKCVCRFAQRFSLNLPDHWGGTQVDDFNKGFCKGFFVKILRRRGVCMTTKFSMGCSIGKIWIVCLLAWLPTCN